MNDRMISIDAALDMAEAEWRAAEDRCIKNRLFGFCIGVITASVLWLIILWITR